MPFVTTPHPEARESLRGYMLRLGELNGYVGLPHLATNLKQGSTNPLDGYPLDVLACQTDIPLNVLSGTISHFRQPEPKGRYVYRGSDALIYQPQTSLYRFCPACLEESGYVRAGWQVLLYPGCFKHRLLLQIRCPGCDAFQTWERSSVTRCKCGALLMDGARERISDEVLQIQAGMDRYARLSACKQVDGRLIEASHTPSRIDQSPIELGKRVIKNLIDHGSTPGRGDYSPCRANELLKKCSRLYLWAEAIDQFLLSDD